MNQEIEQLKNQITNLQSQVNSLMLSKNNNGFSRGFQLSYPLDTQSQKILKDEVSNSILDVLWSEIFYYSTIFESADGFTEFPSVGGVSVGGPLTLVTDGTLNDTIEIYKESPVDVTHDKEQRFRVTLAVDEASTEAYIVLGDNGLLNSITTDNYYGFKIINGAISGITDNNTDSDSVSLGVSVADLEDVVTLEAWLDPENRVVKFFVDGIEKGQTSTGVPKESVGHLDFFSCYLKATTAAVKTLYVYKMEFIQKRDK